MPGRLFESLSENSTSGEDTIPTRIPGIRLPGRIPGILVLRGHSSAPTAPPGVLPLLSLIAPIVRVFVKIRTTYCL